MELFQSNCGQARSRRIPRMRMPPMPHQGVRTRLIGESPMMRLKKITLLKDRVESWEKYPFNVPAIRTLDEIEIKSKICFFVGENGSGKSTLLEAVAAHYGFGREGGSRSFYRVSTNSVSSIDPLVKALRVAFSVRTGKGFYLRAESFLIMRPSSMR